MADEVIDTTNTTIPQLKEMLSRRFSKTKRESVRTVVMSFGYKFGIPLDSDLVFDTRFLPNPFYVDQLRNRTGRSRTVKEYVLKFEETQKYLRALYRFVEFLMPRFTAEGKSSLTIAVGCTGGKHRSVVLSEQLTKHLAGKGYKVRTYHRDIFK